MESAPEPDEMGIVPLPPGPFVDEPPTIERFFVRVWPDGTLYFKGPHDRIDEFLAACAAEGITLTIDHISLCG